MESMQRTRISQLQTQAVDVHSVMYDSQLTSNPGQGKDMNVLMKELHRKFLNI